MAPLDEPAETVDPVQSDDPAEPDEPDEPVELQDLIEPVDLVLLPEIELDKSAEPAESNEPDDPSDPLDSVLPLSVEPLPFAQPDDTAEGAVVESAKTRMVWVPMAGDTIDGELAEDKATWDLPDAAEGCAEKDPAWVPEPLVEPD